LVVVEIEYDRARHLEMDAAQIEHEHAVDIDPYVVVASEVEGFACILKQEVELKSRGEEVAAPVKL